MAVIEIENLTKDFQTGFWRKRPVRALDNLTLNVDSGEVFGFLGPNGAGKTTTLKLLMNLIGPTSGTARILDLPAGSVDLRHQIGYLPENPYFYDYLTAEEILTYMGSLFGMEKSRVRKKVEELLAAVGLVEARKQQLRKFSKGMVQRIGIAQALINEPKVVFLDEPMSGLDPLGRREVRQIIQTLRSQGVTVFFSSHILPDVEALCDRVAIMNKGKLREVGPLHELLKATIQGHEILLANVSDDMLDVLGSMCDEMIPVGKRLQLRTSSSSAKVESVISYAVGQGSELLSVHPIRPSLEDHFYQEVQMS